MIIINSHILGGDNPSHMLMFDTGLCGLERVVNACCRGCSELMVRVSFLC